MNQGNNSSLSFADAYDYLVKELPGTKPKQLVSAEGLKRAAYFFNKLNNPQENFASIHIAGTSGKGTVAYMLSQLLIGHGFHVGTQTSPHVYDIRERFMIDAKQVPKETFVSQVESIIPVINEIRSSPYGQPTFYEAATAIAFSIFNLSKLDYAVIETGLGGLQDATNTISRSDKVAVINTLGFDHMSTLGSTLSEIATQKAGILPKEGHAIALKPKDNEALKTIIRTAEERRTNLELVNPTDYIYNHELGSSTLSYKSDRLTIENITLSLPGEHEISNSVMALRTLEYLADRDGFAIDKKTVTEVFKGLSLPGRFEKVRLFDQDYIFDGAHNVQKINALISSVKASGYDKAPWLLGLKSSSDNGAILESLKDVASSIILTNIISSTEYRPNKLENLASVAREAGVNSIKIIENNIEALQFAKTLAKPNQPVIVAGSFYMLGDIRSNIST